MALKHLAAFVFQTSMHFIFNHRILCLANAFANLTIISLQFFALLLQTFLSAALPDKEI